MRRKAYHPSAIQDSLVLKWLNAILLAIGNLAVLASAVALLILGPNGAKNSPAFTVFGAINVALYSCGCGMYYFYRHARNSSSRNHHATHLVQDKPGTEARMPESTSPHRPIAVLDGAPTKYASAVPDDAPAAGQPAAER